MPLTKIIKELAPDLRDAGNMNAGVLADARLREALREAGRAIPSQDYNLATESGFYAGIGSPAGVNAPPELARYGTLLVGRSSSTYIWQIAGFGSSGTGANEAQLYYRGSNSNGSAWGGWKRIFHQGSILGTVSQSAGAPTGAIIERGSNANGEYVKFADGTMICTHISGAVWAAANTDTNYVWTFPSAFATAPAITAGYEPYSTQGYTVQKFSPGNGSATGSSLFFRTDYAQNFRLAFMAIGRWF